VARLYTLSERITRTLSPDNFSEQVLVKRQEEGHSARHDRSAACSRPLFTPAEEWASHKVGRTITLCDRPSFAERCPHGNGAPISETGGLCCTVRNVTNSFSLQDP
jgi:hypothetical protein